MTPSTVAKRLSKRETLEYVLQHEAISIVFQPIVDLATAQLVGYEALSRGPHGRLYSPGVLFPYAAKVGLITELEIVVSRCIAVEAVALQPNLLFVNLSATTLSNITVVKDIVDRLQPHTSQLVIELTEHQAISPSNLENLKVELEPLRAQGVALAIDDVGSGFSRLQSIAELSPDWIKVDKPLVDRLGVSAMHRHIVNYLVRLAAAIKTRVIAEGVESKSQCDILREAGVDCAQGFYFGRPASVDRIRHTRLTSKR